MAKEYLDRLRQIIRLSETKKTSNSQCETQSAIEKITSETQQRLLLNYRRLTKTGVVKLFEEKTQNKSSNETFRTHIDSTNNRAIYLIWGEEYQTTYPWDTDNHRNKYKMIRAHIDKIDNQYKLFLQKSILNGSHYYEGPKSMVENNLNELFDQKLTETEASQPQTKRQSI